MLDSVARLRVIVSTAMLAAVLLSGCGSGEEVNSLDAYVRSECEITMRTQTRLHDLSRRMMEVGGPTIQTDLATIIAEMARAYEDLLADVEKLGAPPNGESSGTDEQAVAATRLSARELADSANRIRSATSQEALDSAFEDFQQVLAAIATRGLELQQQQKQPTPELDKARAAVPGCAAAMNPTAPGGG
ncbi:MULTISPECIES: hypothetical protein [Actinomycetes]|uniref:hypothetical protein n=1 Tax=unclassified Nocardia TaxID=2637762 RepID=UPI0033BDAD4E